MDNSAVSYIMRTKTHSGRLARWSLLLQDFNITFKHRPGTENHVADCLSWAPINAVQPDEPSQREPHPDKALLPSKKRLVEEQKADSKLGPIVTLLSLGTLPTEPEASKEVERQSAFYMVLNGLLYRKGDDEERMLAVPLALVPAVLFAYHESMFTNHPGAARMFESIKLKYHWPSLAKDVKAHVKACMQCQRRKPLTRSMEPRAGNLDCSKALRTYQHGSPSTPGHAGRESPFAGNGRLLHEVCGGSSPERQIGCSHS